MREVKLINLFPRKTTMAKLKNTTDAFQTADWLKELINTTWEYRAEIEPNYEQERKPTALEIYGWLPKTNRSSEWMSQCFETRFALKMRKREPPDREGVMN